MIYIQEQRHLFCGRTFRELVGRLMSTSFDSANNKKGYMANVAERVKNLYDRHIENHHFKRFVLDLESLGLIKIFKCMNCDNNKADIRCALGIRNFNPELIECPFMVNKEIQKMREARRQNRIEEKTAIKKKQPKSK